MSEARTVSTMKRNETCLFGGARQGLRLTSTAVVLAAMTAAACSRYPEDIMLYWNSYPCYGVFYPPALDSLILPENGKGVKFTDGTAVLWADCTYMMAPETLSDCLPAELAGNDDPVYPSAFLDGSDEALTLIDRTSCSSSEYSRYKLVALGDLFYELSYTYPLPSDERYSRQEIMIFDLFPVILSHCE